MSSAQLASVPAAWMALRPKFLGPQAAWSGRLAALLCAVLLFPLNGCSPAAVVDTEATLNEPAPSLQQSDAVLSAAIAEFGFEMLERTGQDTTQNTILSPVSIHAALAMVSTGASGATAEQMRRVLHVEQMDSGDMNARWARLLPHLAERGADETLTIANAIWAQDDLKIKRDFLDGLAAGYGAQVAELDFGRVDIAREINTWVLDATEEKIEQIIDDVPQEAILVLANAVYFDGDWAEPFQAESTEQATFGRPDSTSVEVDMMFTRRDVAYEETETYQAAKLSYAGERTAFYILLPRRGVDAGDVVRGLMDGEFGRLREALATAEATEIVVGLPKLDIQARLELSDVLVDLGMPLAFDPGAAEFDEISATAPVWIGNLSHTSAITVDELGTEAAGATVVVMDTGSAPEGRPPELICDREFVFALVDELSGVPLFVGKVADPTQ